MSYKSTKTKVSLEELDAEFGRKIAYAKNLPKQLVVQLTLVDCGKKESFGKKVPFITANIDKCDDKEFMENYKAIELENINAVAPIKLFRIHGNTIKAQITVEEQMKKIDDKDQLVRYVTFRVLTKEADNA